jgi:hypothetical protein
LPRNTGFSRDCAFESRAKASGPISIYNLLIGNKYIHLQIQPSKELDLLKIAKAQEE